MSICVDLYSGHESSGMNTHMYTPLCALVCLQRQETTSVVRL